MKVQIKKRVVALMGAMLVAFSAMGCTEADQVSRNISKEADNFNVTRKLTVLNARTDTVLLELTGTFALGNSSANELDKYHYEINFLPEWGFKATHSK